jgi:hypothetical protein
MASDEPPVDAQTDDAMGEQPTNDTASDPAPGDDEWEPDDPTRVDDGTVVVPMRMYKGITVFSTLVATFLVVLGFFLFDAATQAGNPVRRAVVWLVGLVGAVPPSGLLDVGFGLAGIAAILLGAGSYVLGTRFKTAEMLGDGDEE